MKTDIEIANEYPIVCQADEVRAILDGRQTQLRRLVTPMRGKQSGWLTHDLIQSVPHGEMINGGWQMHHPRAGTRYDGVDVEYNSPAGWVRSPFGGAGDRLWVRETWNHPPDMVPHYRADPESDRPEWRRSWRSPTQMPRWASRITLEVTDVRVQRLQDISDEDARAEGVDWSAPHPYGEIWDDDREDPREVGYPSAGGSFARDNYRRLWDSINRTPWATNPWVWVVGFRRCIDDIRKHHTDTEARREWTSTVAHHDGAQAHEDRGVLLGMIDEREADMHARIRAGYDQTVADCWRAENEQLKARIAELEARVAELERFHSDVARAVGVEYLADGHAPQPGPLSDVLAYVQQNAARIADLERENHRHREGEAVTPPTKLTPGERRTLEAIAWRYSIGLRDDGQPHAYLPRGGQHGVCERWQKLGMLTGHFCRDADAAEAREVYGYALTDAGIAWAKSLGVEVGL